MPDQEPQFRSLPREQRRTRILQAAKRVLLERGWDAANMDDVAARAGTTKPTVYAHFASKDELFEAVARMVKGLIVDELRSPDHYAAEPVEAVTLFCGRYLELVTWHDAVTLQRTALAAAARSPTMARAVHDAVFAEAGRALAEYLASRHLAADPQGHATLILSAATGGQLLRHLFGVEASAEGLPDPAAIGARVDMERVRHAVTLVASTWEPGRVGTRP